MTFLTPLLLLGLVGLAVPILLHLLKRQERRTRVFPALRYLKRSTREHARIVRLRQLLLLALRLAAVTLIALAGARLVLPLGGSDDPPAGIAIVVDNGLTSGAVVGEGRVLDSLVARVEQALDRTGRRDQVWILPAGAPLRPAVPLPPEAAMEAARALSPTHVTPSLPAALERAASLVDAGAPELRELIVVSDLRPEAFGAIQTGPSRRPDRVLIAPPPGRPPGNRGIGDLLISGGLTPRAGDLGEIEVQVVGADVAGSTVRAYVDQRLVGTTEAGSDGSAVLPLPRLPVGWVRGSVEVEPDGLRGDDVRYFALRTIPPPSVQLLGPVSSFLEEALSVLDQAGRIELVEEGGAQIQVISGRATSEPSPDATIILIPPDETAVLPSLNQELSRLAPGWSLEADLTGVGSEMAVSGGLLSGSLPSLPLVRRTYTIRSDEARSRVTELLTLSDGRPWVLEIMTGARSVVVLGSPMTLEASSLPASASMLPLIELLVSRSPGSVGAGEVWAGEAFSLPDGASTVGLPDGTVRAVAGASRFDETEIAGVYEVLDSDGQILSLVAVNAISPGASAGLTMEEAASRLADGWEEVDIGDSWPGSVLRDRLGREVAGQLLLGLLLVLVAESWLASGDLGTSKRSRRPEGELDREG